MSTYALTNFHQRDTTPFNDIDDALQATKTFAPTDEWHIVKFIRREDRTLGSREVEKGMGPAAQ